MEICKTLKVMDADIRFTYAELNALNKLLWEVKFAAELDAQKLDFYALSPFIITAFEKIHKEYMNQFRLQHGMRKYKGTPPSKILDPQQDFQMEEANNMDALLSRLKDMDPAKKAYLKKLDSQQIKAYALQHFAPFQPTEKQLGRMVSALKTVPIKAIGL